MEGPNAFATMDGGAKKRKVAKRPKTKKTAGKKPKSTKTKSKKTSKKSKK